MRMAVLIFAAFAALAAVPVLAQIEEGRASELRAEIARAGSLRVIVTVSTDRQGEPGAAAKLNQQELLNALRGTEHKVAFVFPSTPLVALIVGPDALQVLLSHPLVTSIMVDRPRTASTAPP